MLWIALGANDIGMGRTPSQIVADITALRNRWSSADCVLVIEPDNGDNGAAHANYVTAMRTLAVTLDLPLLDMSLRLGTHAQMVAAQIMGPDDIHLNAVGQSDWAAVTLEGVQSVARAADGLATVKATADASTGRAIAFSIALG
ncbi:hypothetical protein [Mycolicibacterium llatzerense]|uniref:hypothetical protein n=1 Tax=Mycolicibacterium llatzerense TaxID=280871 RepID=UPI003898F007